MLSLSTPCVVSALITILGSTAAAAATPSPPPTGPESSEVRRDFHIVTLKTDTDRVQHIRAIGQLHGHNADYTGVYQDYHFPGFQGYAGHFNESFLRRLEQHAEVVTTEPDRQWKAARLEAVSTPNYGLSLISHRAMSDINTYVYDSAIGRGSYAYILDTGINVKHVEFGGRASVGANFAPLQGGPPDASGHGTHIAGIIGSDNYGVARHSKLISVKISNDGTTYTSIMLKGFEWAVKDILKHRRAQVSVINISMECGTSDAFDWAVNSAFAKSILSVVAAGNDNRNTAYFSPNRAKAAIVVAATDQRRRRAPFSNYGSRVSLFAPGVKIPSTWIGANNKGIATASGTSQAAAHVSGLILYLKMLDRRLLDPFACKNYLIRTATTGIVADPMTAPNIFAYNSSGK